LSCGEDKKRATYGEEGGHVEAEEHIGVVEEVADAHGSRWTRRKWIFFSAQKMRYTKGVKSGIALATES
jgi:hypothetical protein